MTLVIVAQYRLNSRNIQGYAVYLLEIGAYVQPKGRPIVHELRI